MRDVTRTCGPLRRRRPVAHRSGNTSEFSLDTSVTSEPQADLILRLSDAPDPVQVGQALTYTVIVTNNGPTRARDVTVTDVLPTGVTFVSATPSQGSCSGTATVT